MRILFHLIDAQVAGGQIVAEQIAREALVRGHHVGLLVPSSGPMLERFQALGAATHLIPMTTLRRPWIVRRASRLFLSYDALYSHTSVSGQILGDMASRLAGIPHVIHQHATPYLSPRWPQNAVQAAMFRQLRAIRWIAVGEHVCGALTDAGISSRSIHVVPNGAPDPAVVPSREAASQEVLVGMVARIDPGKGIGEFVEALSGMAGDDFQGVVMGRPGPFVEYEHRLRSRLARSDLGLVETDGAAASFLSQLDVVAIPSHYEGSPLVLFEAMALGKAIVASDIPGIREVIEDGRNGLLVPRGDVEVLRSAVRRLIDDPKLRARLGAQARRDAEERYPMRRTVERCLSMLEDAVSEWQVTHGNGRR